MSLMVPKVSLLMSCYGSKMAKKVERSDFASYYTDSSEFVRVKSGFILIGPLFSFVNVLLNII